MQGSVCVRLFVWGCERLSGGLSEAVGVHEAVHGGVCVKLIAGWSV